MGDLFGIIGLVLGGIMLLLFGGYGIMFLWTIYDNKMSELNNPTRKDQVKVIAKIAGAIIGFLLFIGFWKLNLFLMNDIFGIKVDEGIAFWVSVGICILVGTQIERLGRWLNKPLKKEECVESDESNNQKSA